jgi:hypothetical protein
MKYILAQRNGRELLVVPTDDTAGDDEIARPDHILDFILRSTPDAPDAYEYISVRSSELYALMEDLGKWCKDPRPLERDV